MRHHIHQFESLRGIAAMWVVVSHMLLISEIGIKYLSDGASAVELFIILSGFVITLMRLNTPESYPAYLVRRIGRLYPLYLVALTLGLLTTALYAQVIGPSFWGGSESEGFIERGVSEREHLASHIGLHLAMLHGMVPDTWLPQANLTISGPLWSISLEWQFYLIAPLLIAALAAGAARRWVAPLVAGALIALGYFLARQYWQGGVPSFLPLRLPMFAVGILCALYWKRAHGTPPWKLALIVGAAFGVCVLLGAGRLATLMWFGTYFVAATHDRLAAASAINRILVSRGLRWIGERSYGIYVLHMPVALSVGYWLVPHFTQMGQKLSLLAMSVGTLAVVLPAAALCYRCVEVPMNRWAKGVATRMEKSRGPARALVVD